MARAGDEDEIGYGASVAYLSDAARRRAERGDPSPDDVVPAPDPDAGIELITSLDAGDDVEESADDALERALARGHGASQVLPVPEARERESPVEPAGPREGEQRSVREALEHHHERLDSPTGRTIAARGSADLPPRAGRSSAPAQPQSSKTASRLTGPRRVTAGSLGAVVLLVVIVAIYIEVSSSPARHHRAPAAMTRVSTQRVASPISVIALKSRQASAAIGVEAEIAASAHAAIEAKAKAQVEARARARARAAQRAQAAAARRRRAAAQRAHATSAGPAAVVSTQTTGTGSVSTTPVSSAGSSSTASSSGGGGQSGGSAAPAGPTGIGSAGSNCNPKCS